MNKSSTKWHAFLVASGILLSRIAGLIRESVFAYFFGNSVTADALKAAFRIPNLLQNLFGEGVLSASFIPVYAKLMANGKEEEARIVAGAIAAIIMLATSILVLIGVIGTPWIINLITPGFTGEKKELCILLVRILFPGAGLMVWSAWCLGILNSHGRFFLSYTAPVVWNFVIIAVLIVFGNKMGQSSLSVAVAWASVAGSLMQILYQLPMVILLLNKLKLSLNYRISHVLTIIRNFVPVFFSRGVVQISSYIDAMFASFLPTGAISALTYAQILYVLPVSLFGMSVSAAELPAMSKITGTDDEVAKVLRNRLNSGLRQIAFFIVPSAMAFLAFGDVICAAIYQHGAFKIADSVYVWGILAGSSIGLLATTLSRLYSSTFYAMRDTRTPLNFAIIRILLSTILGYIAVLHLPSWIGIDKKWGVAMLTVSSGFCGWVEFSFLRFSLNRRIGKTGLNFSYNARLWLAAIFSSVISWCIKLYVGPSHHPVILAIPVLSSYGIIYFSICLIMQLPEVLFVKRLIKRV